ncbi:PDZ domain-containing protein [Caenorhabditis elegans]|nr:PDZ domain-containing protein [Caenorhabditis elegans]CAD1857024.1 PDZ domain-containing protein [Caenorhabditis elegans]
MNAFMDSYFGDAFMNTAEPSKPQNLLNSLHSSKSQAEEDLETLMKETDDMQDIQDQIHMEQIEMADKYREERSKQKRAAAARSRYQRMTENERRVYNHRRRLKQLGVDPEHGTNDVEGVRTQMKQANAKKAEAARQRYHRMTPEQKRDYNHRRTEAFRRRRHEEELLLSTPAGRISQEALEKAQQIMIRNARKAESARLRYQRMTPDERKSYNMKRAAAKKTRKEEEEKPDDMEHYGDNEEHLMDSSGTDFLDEQQEVKLLEDISSSNTIVPHHQLHHPAAAEVMEAPNNEICQEHMLDVINQVAHPPNELGIFTRMENDVLRRTKKANATIQKNHHHIPHNAIVGGIQYDMTQQMTTDDPYNNLSTINEPSSSSLPPPQQPSTSSTTEPVPPSRVIDEQTLHDIVRSGMDVNGRAVEIRTVDGQRITCIQDLLNVSHGQTVLITERVETSKIPRLVQPPPPPPPQIVEAVTQDWHVGSSTSSIPPHYTHHHPTAEDMDYDDIGEEALTQDEIKLKCLKARRAERARARYHRMSEEKRREQNARRALMLRKARARDDELLKIAETTPMDEIEESIAAAIRDAQQRRARKAEQARSKYRRMTDEEKRRFNAARDAHKRGKKESETSLPPAPPTDPELSQSPLEEPSTSSPGDVIDPDDASSFFYGVFHDPYAPE